MVISWLALMVGSVGAGALGAHDDQVGTQSPALSFEDAPVGELGSWESALGRWTAAPGHAEIDDQHARSGSRCLHLFGGPDRQVELTLKPGREAAVLTFWAERWTRRDPFRCHVDAHTSDGWKELRDLSSEIRVGGFLTRVQCSVPAGADRLRLRCTSPGESGLLVDDLDVEAPHPVFVASCTTVQPVLPVLVGNTINPIARIDLHVDGNQGALTVEEVEIDLGGTSDLEDFERVELFFGGARERLEYLRPNAVFTDADRFGAATTARPGAIVFRGRRQLELGLNTLWISVRPKAGADLDGRVDAGCSRVTLLDGTRLTPELSHPPRRQRMGVALRNDGDDGSAVYRIPGLATTPRGTLIAVYDIRWKGWGDLPGDVDVGMSRSTDGGRTWEPMRTVMDAGDDRQWQHDGVGDPAILVDRNTGQIHVIATWSHGNRAWRGSGPGLGPGETGQLMLTTSDDDGKTWSALRNLTASIKDPEWSYLLQGPGRGITLSDGRIVFPAQFLLSPDQARMPHSTIIHSADHGKTWFIGTGARSNTTESAVVELEDGRLMLNMRDNRGGSRAIATTLDLGIEWATHPSSRRSLPEPVCMASLIHVGRETTGVADGVLLFSNPKVDDRPRRNMTIQKSTDHGLTWPQDGSLLLDEGASAGYSCLTMIDARTVGILYEGSRAHMTFQRIPLKDFGD